MFNFFKQKNIYKKGFNLIEIILSIAIIMIVFTSVFNFIVHMYIKLNTSTFLKNYFSYGYGQAYCNLNKDISNIDIFSNKILLSKYISTSTRITSVNYIQNNNFIITTDSASTSESDIFLFSISTTTLNLEYIYSIDVGPGIQDGILLGNLFYIANTSVNSHVKSFYINTLATSTDIFTELSNIKIYSLANSLSNPKKLSIYNYNLVLGTEKNNSGPEVFYIPIESDGSVKNIVSSTEIGGQLNQSLSAYENLYLANASDPELYVLNKWWQNIFSYDAPLTLGNGKSILYLHPHMILGRTIGSSELTLLSNITEILDTKRTNGTVDFLQEFSNSSSSFLAITANDTKELQFFDIQNSSLHLSKTLDLPGRVTAYTCVGSTLYLFTTLNNQTTLSWINL